MLRAIHDPSVVATGPRTGLELNSVVIAGKRENGSSWCMLNPLETPRWDSLLATHDGGCFFHTAAWARVLHETYGHHPVYFCRVAGEKLQGLLPVMEVSQRWGGLRAISLPFTDFCHTLFDKSDCERNPYEVAINHGRSRGWKSFECRCGGYRWEGALPSQTFYGHHIALDRPPEALFKRLKPAVRRCVKRAQTSGLRVEFSQSPQAMKDFYNLHCLTRRHHGLPPQPFNFFESITRHVLAGDQGVIVSAYLQDKPIAAAVFFYHKRKALFKFGASDASFLGYRPNNLVMWSAMQWCVERGFEVLHLGRTSVSNAGLRRFKRGFGAEEEAIEYCKYDFHKEGFVKSTDHAEGPANHVFRLMPVSMLRWIGGVLYPHLG